MTLRCKNPQQTLKFSVGFYDHECYFLKRSKCNGQIWSPRGYEFSLLRRSHIIGGFHLLLVHNKAGAFKHIISGGMSTWQSSVCVDLDAVWNVCMGVFGLVPAVDANGGGLIRMLAHIIKSEYSAAKLNRLGWCFKGSTNSWAESKCACTRARTHTGTHI